MSNMNPSSHFEVLAHVVEIANTSVDVSERLDSILGAVNSHLGARLSALFMQEHRRSQLVLANTWPHDAGQGEPLMVDFGQGLVGEVARARKPMVLPVPAQGEDHIVDALANAGEGASLFPVMDDNRLYAVLLLVFPADSNLESDAVRLMQMVSREMAGAIRNFRLYFEAKKRIAELNVLSDLGREAVSTIEVDQLMDTVAGICAKLLGARGGLVRIDSKNGEALSLRESYGQVPAQCLQGEICGLPCEETTEPLTGQRARVCTGEHVARDFREGLCVPLTFKGLYRGQLCVFDKVVSETDTHGRFTPEDHNLLSSMSAMVSAALENALVFQRVEVLAQRNEEMVTSMATLFEISTVLMTTVDFSETVQIILQAVTHPAGLGHDRVLLFLTAQSETVLQAAADLTRPAEGSQVRELTRTLLENKGRADWGGLLSPALSNLRVPLVDDDNVLARTVNMGKSILVQQGQNEKVPPELDQALGGRPFATVPMYAKGKVVGVMVVSHALSGEPFSQRGLRLLAMLANLGGLALENSRLYQNLENANRELALMRSRLLEADKLAALGEVAAGVAHEIRNPLVSIGGFTRRIRKKVGADSPITAYLDVIIEEVTRLERTLNEMLDFSTDGRNHFEEHDLGQVMNDTLALLGRELRESHIEVERDLISGMPPVYCDDRQIKHVFLNLFNNAIQAMGKDGGTLLLRTFAITREGKQFVAAEISDTGGGIPKELVHKVFNPFFTTKDSGSGLGLSIVHKIVTRHFGQVEVHNREPQGASFLITLPAAEEGRAYLK